MIAAVLLSLFVTTGTSAQPAKPIVYVLSTGGTIAGSGSSSTDLSNYKPGAILGEQLVKAVPQIAQIADVRVEQIVNVRSSDLTIENWLTLTKRIQAILKETPAVAGFVDDFGHQHARRDRVFPAPDGSLGQAGRAGWLHASRHRHLG